MKPKILIKVVSEGANGNFILEYPDHAALRCSLEQALPKLIEGGMFTAHELQFPLRIGGIEHQYTPTMTEHLYFPGTHTVQRCIDECKKLKAEIVSYTIDRNHSHEFIVRRKATDV